MAEALYRKYRPQVFDDVVGQEHIERTIKNALVQDKVSHAYLFCGPRGTGKTTTARLLAKALLCESGPTAQPDGMCASCREIAAGEHPDVYELDAASRTGVENVREEIIGRVQFSPTRGRHKVYIIDEVHMLSTAAFNALLKTLEEPPDHVIFILCTTDPRKVPETIQSRCQRFDFRRIANEEIVTRLGAVCVAEEVEFEGSALELIAYRAEGGMRDALTSLEQLITFGEGSVTLELAERLLGSLESNDLAEIVGSIGKRDIATCFQWTANYVESGADLAQFVRDLAQHMRNMYVLRMAGSDVSLEISEPVRRELVEEMQYFGEDRLARMLAVLGELSAELRVSSNQRLSFEIALTRLVRPDSDVTLEALVERVEALEAGYSAVAHVMQGPASAPASVQASEQTPASASAPASEQPPAQAPASTPAPAATHPQTSPATQVRLDLTNPAVLQRTWQVILTALKKKNVAYGALFINTSVTYDSEKNELVVSFPNPFVFKQVQKLETKEPVKELLHQTLGVPLDFRFVLLESDRRSRSEQIREQKPEPEPALPSSSVPAAALAPESDYDQVPLDAYDALTSAVSATAATSATASTTPPPSAPVAAPTPASLSAPAAAAVSFAAESDLNTLLTEAFGEGVSLEELDTDQ